MTFPTPAPVPPIRSRIFTAKRKRRGFGETGDAPSASPGFSFDPLLHAYMVGSVQVPSVTQVLEDVGLKSKYENVPAWVLERKRQIGEATHLATEYLDAGELDWDSLDVQIVPYVIAYERFLDKTAFQVQLAEYRTVAEFGGLRFGMTLDREGFWRNPPEGWEPEMPTILDIKTASNQEPWWQIQTAGYAIGRSNGVIHHQRGVLWLKKNGAYELQRHTDKNDVDVFMSALRLCHWKRKYLR